MKRPMLVPFADDIHKYRLPLRVLDLFAGAGGLSLGFQRYNDKIGHEVFRLVGAIEVDKDACATLRYNHPELSISGEDSRIIEDDITRESTHATVIKRFGTGEVDIIVGGPPCQSFSMLGTRSGRWVNDTGQCKEDSRDLLFVEYIRIVHQLQPLFVVLENVDGIRSKKDDTGQTYLSRIIRELNGIGYSFSIDDHKEKYLRLNAADYGVPQIRHRVFLVGSRIENFSVIPPRPTHYDPLIYSDPTLPFDRKKWVTLHEAIGDLPWLQARYTSSNVTVDRWLELQDENSRRRWCLNQETPDESVYHDEDLHRHFATLETQGQEFLDFVTKNHGPRLRSHFARSQQSSDIALFSKMPAGATAKMIFEGGDEFSALKELIRYDMGSFKDKYRKQQWDRPGTTVFAHLERDGNRFIHPDSTQARTFTVREAARVQSFPDNYIFAGCMKNQYKQIGNAVPPLLARAVAESIYLSLTRHLSISEFNGVNKLEATT